MKISLFTKITKSSLFNCYFWHFWAIFGKPHLVARQNMTISTFGQCMSDKNVIKMVICKFTSCSKRGFRAISETTSILYSSVSTFFTMWNFTIAWVNITLRWWRCRWCSKVKNAKANRNDWDLHILISKSKIINILIKGNKLLEWIMQYNEVNSIPGL